MAWIIDLANKTFKAALITRFQKLKKSMLEEVMENTVLMREQIRKLGREMETVIKNQMEILELKN